MKQSVSISMQAGGDVPFTGTGAPPDMPGAQEGLCPLCIAGWAGQVSVTVGGSLLPCSAQKMQQLSMGRDTDGRLRPRACVSSYLHTQTYSSLKSICSHMRLSAGVCTCISHKCNVGAQPSEVSKLSIRH